MITLRHIERLFFEHKHLKLFRELALGRPEADCALEPFLARAVPAAAMGVIRLDELNQSHTPLYRRLINAVLTAQQRDGGWEDPMVTAVCLRALMTSTIHADAVAKGLALLAGLQKSDGAWPREPIRRMPADALTSAYILLQLAEREVFRGTVRFDAAVRWLECHVHPLEPHVQRLWTHAAVRCRVAHAPPRNLWTLDRSAA